MEAAEGTEWGNLGATPSVPGLLEEPDLLLARALLEALLGDDALGHVEDAVEARHQLALGGGMGRTLLGGGLDERIEGGDDHAARREHLVPDLEAFVAAAGVDGVEAAVLVDDVEG